MLLGPHVDGVAHQCERGVHRLIDRIRTEDFVLRTGLDHESLPGFGREEYFAGGGDRRCHELRRDRDPLAFIFDLSGLRIETGEAAVIRDQVHVALIYDGRRYVCRALLVFPGDVIIVSSGYPKKLTYGLRLDGELFWIAAADDYHIADLHRRMDGVRTEPLRAPQFMAVRGIVGDDGFIAADDELSIHHNRRRPGCLNLARRLPQKLSVLLRERREE